jgi:hypothetical protein
MIRLNSPVQNGVIFLKKGVVKYINPIATCKQQVSCDLKVYNGNLTNRSMCLMQRKFKKLQPIGKAIPKPAI